MTGVLVLLPGCVERKLTIRSKPENARLYMNYQDQGRTPKTVEFSYYGTRDVRLEKHGYKIKESTVEVDTPLYSYFPFNFITELLLPFTITDHRVYEFDLEPYNLKTSQDSEAKQAEKKKKKKRLKRAEKLRTELPDGPSEKDSEK